MYYARYLFDESFVSFKTKEERDKWVDSQEFLVRIPIEDDETVGKIGEGYVQHIGDDGLTWFDPPETYIDEDGLVWYPIDL